MPAKGREKKGRDLRGEKEEKELVLRRAKRKKGRLYLQTPTNAAIHQMKTE